MATRTLMDVLTEVSALEGFFCPKDLGSEGLVGVNTKGYAEDAPLHVVAWGNDIQGAEILLAAGADPNALGDLGETPLHVAVRKENLALVKLLLAYGADPGVRSDYEDTPLDLVKDSGGALAMALTQGGT